MITSKRVWHPARWMSAIVIVGALGFVLLSAAPALPQQATPAQKARANSYGHVVQAAKAHGRASLAVDPTTREIHSDSRLVIETGGPQDAADQLGQSSCDSDAVVVGDLSDGTSYLAADDEFIFTDYHLQVAKVLRGVDVTVGDVLTYVRPGGRLKIKGRPVVTTHNDYPELAEHTRYVLFLTKLPDGSYKAADKTGWTLSAVEIGGATSVGVGPQAIKAMRTGLDELAVEQAIATRPCEK